MVVNDSIAFAAPSQMRFHMVSDDHGVIRGAVLNAYNEPIGALRGLRASLADIHAFCRGEQPSIEINSEAAKLTFTMADGMDKGKVEVKCEEPARWFEMTDYLVLSELVELANGQVAHQTGPTVI